MMFCFPIYDWVRRYWAALTLGWLLVIAYFCLLPLPELPPFPGTDKLHHLLAYLILALPVAVRRHPRWWQFALLFIFFSGAIELIQPYVNRYGEWLDLLANTVGVMFGLLLGYGMGQLERYWRNTE